MTFIYIHTINATHDSARSSLVQALNMASLWFLSAANLWTSTSLFLSLDTTVHLPAYSSILLSKVYFARRSSGIWRILIIMLSSEFQCLYLESHPFLVKYWETDKETESMYMYIKVVIYIFIHFEEWAGFIFVFPLI